MSARNGKACTTNDRSGKVRLGRPIVGYGGSSASQDKENAMSKFPFHELRGVEAFVAPT